jgi:tetratricopeptide (TPR) repeat protein
LRWRSVRALPRRFCENYDMDKLMKETDVHTAQQPGAVDFAASKAAVLAGSWNAGISAFERALAAGARPVASARVYRAMAGIRAADNPADAVAELDPGCLRESGARADLRRLVVSPLVRAGSLETAVLVLLVALDAWPESVDDRRLLASLLGRLKRWDEAIAHADLAAGAAPDDASLHAARIQLRLQAGAFKDAADIARSTAGCVADGNESAQLWLTALTRDGDTASAARLAAGLDPARFANERVAASVVGALTAGNLVQAAIDAGERALQANLDGAALRSQLGQAYLARGREDDRTVSALAHLEKGCALAPEDVRLVSLYGETLMGAGRYADAIEPLQQACELAPKLEHPRAMLARALRFAGRLPEAAHILLELTKMAPNSQRLKRSTIAALSQCGREDEAGAMFESYLARRTAALPDSFMEALANIDKNLDQAPIPQARLDWAWSMRSGAADMDRAEWERAARWGHQVDHLLLEWLECRDDRVEEAMSLLGDLDEAERFFAPLLASGKGFVVATAHVGPMYAGLMALELLGIPSRWVSSTPGVSRAAYASALISTADRTQAQVAKDCLRALDGGFAVCLAVDGAPNPSAPRIDFEGQAITYSSFAARAAHRLRLPSVFYAPCWVEGKVVQTLTMLPGVRDGEDVETYAARWQDAYLALLRAHIAGAPENLRLSGGLWRHVRPVDRSPAAKL